MTTVGRQRYRPNKPIPFRMRLWIKQHYRCGICGKQIRQRILFKHEINIDHIRPRSHGGTRDPENLQIVHMACNQEKADQCGGCEGCPT